MSEEKICAGCGIEYQPKKGQASWRKYCSRACQIKSYNAKRYVGNAPEICPECGDKIEQEEQKGRYRRYCSDQCRIKYNARNLVALRAIAVLCNAELLYVLGDPIKFRVNDKE